ncbi:MAG: hypothetical protein LBT40_03410 [Deltaproteobacteria bacterium]|jgi:hypothetical protein|nr:hypothetical protein [Deltaproteobacteria bacterium]
MRRLTLAFLSAGLLSACLWLVVVPGQARSQGLSGEELELSPEDMVPLSQSDIDFYEDYCVFQQQPAAETGQDGVDDFLARRRITPMRRYVIDQRVGAVLFGNFISSSGLQPSQEDIDLINRNREGIEKAFSSSGSFE